MDTNTAPARARRADRALERAPAMALAVAAAAFAMLASGGGTAHAAGIQRCTAPDGTTVYTDRPCAAHGARADAMPASLASRLTAAGSIEGGGYADASMPLRPGGAARGPSTARRSAAAGCARSPTQLAMDLQGAFALGDVNRIAESFHWVGMGHGAASGVMQRLERLAHATLVDTRYYDASIVSSGIGSWADAGAPVSSASGIMQLTLGGETGAGALDLDVKRYEGCYFVSF